jgi:Zn-dependent M32 family carboxypeptidase
MMPPGAAASRAAQKSALSSVIHAKQTDPEIGVLLDRLQGCTPALDEYRQATVREAARAYKKATCIPEELVRKEADLSSRAYQGWVQARQEKRWELFSPLLREWVELRRQRAALVDPSRPAYDVLADDYDPGLTGERVSEVFGRVRDGLVPLLKSIRERGEKPETSWLQGEFDTSKQADLCKDVAVALGFDLQNGRLDVSVHPFTGGAHPTDVRMTTRFKPDDITEGLTGAIHETGHALYEQGRNLEHDGLPVSAAAGMAIHESQSLLWERMVGLSRPFAAYLLPKLQAQFPDAFAGRAPEELYAAMNAVKEVSMIRVEADEVTYPMHVILRFEIEKGLVEGSVDPDDVPALWNEKMKEYLGVEPADDAQGCLQDLHWSMGAIGYFPTYTLGAMSAVQIFDAAKADLPGLDEALAAGDFAPLRGWLKEKVHRLGSLYPSADDLLEVVTGRALDPDVFLRYLEDKYRDIYRLS